MGMMGIKDKIKDISPKYKPPLGKFARRPSSGRFSKEQLHGMNIPVN